MQLQWQCKWCTGCCVLIISRLHYCHRTQTTLRRDRRTANTSHALHGSQTKCSMPALMDHIACQRELATDTDREANKIVSWTNATLQPLCLATPAFIRPASHAQIHYDPLSRLAMPKPSGGCR